MELLEPHSLKSVRPSDVIDRIDSKWQARYKSGVGMMLLLIKNSRPDSIDVVLELYKCMDGASNTDYKVTLRGMKFDLDTNIYCLRCIQWMKEKNGMFYTAIVIELGMLRQEHAR
jgi:hypothetical protein